MSRFEDISPDFEKILRHAGWEPDRQVNIDEWVVRLEQEGFRPIPLAINLLKSFGGMSVQIPPSGTNPYDHELRFDPVRAATGEFDRAEDWKNELGIDLFPLGEEVTSGHIVWVGSDGKIYYGRGFGLYLIGDSFRLAMDWLAFPQFPPKLCAD